MNICLDPSASTLAMNAHHFLVEYQTLIAAGVAVVFGIPVWRQFKPTNLQAQMAHRQTLLDILKVTEERNKRVGKDLMKPLNELAEIASDPSGEEAFPVSEEAAHHYGQIIPYCLDWYLVALKGTESNTIEAAKSILAEKIKGLDDVLHMITLPVRVDFEEHDVPKAEEEKIRVDSIRAKLQVDVHVIEVSRAFRALVKTQEEWTATIRAQLTNLDLLIVSHR